MFAIQVGTTFLDLKGASIRWETVNEVFSENSFQGDWSFPFDIQFSPTNLKALGFVNKAEVPNKKLRLNVTVYFGSNSYKALLIINGSKASFNCSLAGGVKGLINADKKLSELNFKSITTGFDYIDLGASFGNLASYQFANWKLGVAFIPHYNPEFYGTLNPDFNGVVNRMDTTVGSYMQNTTILGNKYCISPWLYLFFILKTIFDENGLAMDGTFIADSEASNLLVYANYALDKQQNQGVILYPLADYYHTVGNVQFSTLAPGSIDEGNNWDDVGFDYTAPGAGDYAVIVNVNYRFDGVGSMVLLVTIYRDATEIYRNNFFGEIITGQTIVNRTYSVADPGMTGGEVYSARIAISFGGVQPVLLKTTSLEIRKYDDDIYNEMTTTMYYKNHVPDLTVAEFIAKIKNVARIKTSFDWGSRVARLDYISDALVSQPQIDLTPFASLQMEQVFDDSQQGFIFKYDFGNDAFAVDTIKPFDKSRFIGYYNTLADLPAPAFVGYYAIVLNTNYVWKTNEVLVWVFHSHNYQQIEFGDKTKDFTVEFAPMLMTADEVNESATSDPDHIKCLMPMISERGSSPMFDLGTNAPSLRLVFMRGRNIDYTGIGGRYIYATPTHIDINGNSVGSYNLKLEGDTNNWYKSKHQTFLEAMDGGEYYEALITIPLNYLKYNTKIQIKNINYLVKNISTGITIHNVKQSLFKLLKL